MKIIRVQAQHVDGQSVGVLTPSTKTASRRESPHESMDPDSYHSTWEPKEEYVEVFNSQWSDCPSENQ